MFYIFRENSRRNVRFQLNQTYKTSRIFFPVEKLPRRKFRVIPVQSLVKRSLHSLYFALINFQFSGSFFKVVILFAFLVELLKHEEKLEIKKSVFKDFKGISEPRLIFTLFEENQNIYHLGLQTLCITIHP